MSAENPQNTVKLLVGGGEYAGWKSVRIAAGLERLARDFEVSVTDRWPGSLEQARRIRPGDFVQVLVGNDLMVSGYVDATPLEYDAHGYTLLIRGRSRTADLVDSAPDNQSQQWKNAKAEIIAKDLAQPYGVDVRTEVATGDALLEHQVQQGETVFDSLDRMAGQRQFLMTDDERGRLVLTKPGGGGQASTALILGENILSGQAGFDYTEVYSEYQVKGQRAGDDEEFGAKVAQGIGKATDTSMARKRVLVVRQPGQADTKTLEDRAQYEQQIRRAKAGEIRYKVADWRQADGSLWRPNQSVAIKDAWMEVDGTLLISEVIFTLDDQSGMVTELVCIEPGAFATAPQTEKEQRDKGGSLPAGIDWADVVDPKLPVSTGKDAPSSLGGITWVDPK